MQHKAHLESAVAEHYNDTQQYHCCKYSSSYDDSSRCHSTSSPSNPGNKQKHRVLTVSNTFVKKEITEHMETKDI